MNSSRATPRRIALAMATVAVASTFLPFSLAAQCTLCGDQIIPSNSLSFGDDSGEDVSCRTLFDALQGIREGSGECSKIQLASYQAGCCGENFVPRNACALCPDGAPFQESITIPRTNTESTTTGLAQEERRDLTCGDLVDELSFLDFFHAPGDCSDTYLQRSAGWCGCPGREIECTICPDGSRVQDPHKMEKVLYGWDCATFEYVTALLSSVECPTASLILDFDASAFCCPHVVAPPEVCSFCPNTQVLGDPNKEILTDFGLLTCGDVAESLSLVPTQDSCDFARSKFNSEQCCVYPEVAKASSGKESSSSPVASLSLALGSISLAAAALFVEL